MGGRLSKCNLNGLEVSICHSTGITSNSSSSSGQWRTDNDEQQQASQYYSPYTATSNLTIPHFINPNTFVSTHLYNIEPIIFDFKTSTNWYAIKSVGCNVLSGKFIVGRGGNSLLELCSRYTLQQGLPFDSNTNTNDNNSSVVGGGGSNRTRLYQNG